MKTNFLLFTVTCLFCFVLGETTLRLLISEQSLRDRFLMWSSPHFFLHESGAVNYRPNETVREVAVYFGEIEYDITYKTNNHGYIDDEPYRSISNVLPKRSIAVVGDSFTASSGGTPWVPRLRKKLQHSGQDIFLYNLGLTGASVTLFYKNLVHFSKSFPVREIVVVGISNDFERLGWWPLINGVDIRLCPEEEGEETCMHRLPFAKVVDLRLSETDLLDQAKKIRASYKETLQKRETRLFTPFRQSRLLQLGLNFISNHPLFALGEQNQEVSPPILRFLKQKNLKAIKDMRKKFPKIKISFLHLPEKQEVDLGHYRLNIEKEIKEAGVEYLPALKKCSWTKDMFYKNDAHPNQKGYDNVANCFSKLVLNVEN